MSSSTLDIISLNYGCLDVFEKFGDLAGRMLEYLMMLVFLISIVVSVMTQALTRNRERRF